MAEKEKKIQIMKKSYHPMIDLQVLKNVQS